MMMPATNKPIHLRSACSAAMRARARQDFDVKTEFVRFDVGDQIGRRLARDASPTSPIDRALPRS